MRSAKSINSLVGQQQQQATNTNTNGRGSTATTSGPTSPICRCRVMYLGSSVPHITKDGLQGIQEPLRELYPDKNTLDSGNAGIDSWLSVWSNGILIENVDENGREVKRFFKIDALHYCAAVKYVGSNPQQQQLAPYTSLPNGNLANLPKFLPLDSPHARLFTKSPPVFASILRRTTGIKVLECHAFICKREAAANALVRCCFHAYADTMYAKQIEGSELSQITSSTAKITDLNNNNNNNSSENESHYANNNDLGYSLKQNDGPVPTMTARRSKSIAALNEDGGNNNSNSNQTRVHPDHHTMMRRKSVNEHYANGCDTSDNVKHMNNNDSNLRKQHKLSKSLHHLNQNGNLNYGQQSIDCNGYPVNQSTSASCINVPPPNRLMIQQQQVPPLPQQQPFYNPYSARVPSYPPQNMLDVANNGGTLRSIKSMAANSIASTLLRSKKHAKAMSMAQLNQEKIISFHQPHGPNGTTISGPLMMPPVPPMFLPNLPARSIINGSQTMKPTSRSMVMGPPQMNFEAMTPKEMKKLLKKSAKYGIDPSRFGENGLPLMPIRPPPQSIPMQLQLQPPPPQANHLTQHSHSGTMVSQSMYSDMYGNDMPDMISMHSGLPPPPSRGPMMLDPLDQHQMKPILVKPNPEFLKTKAGKKWLKQQKEFKKLLPPHLDGLPIVFGPPPVGALEPACLPPPPPPAHLNGSFPPPPNFIPPTHPGLPMMDTSGYYNPHPFYGQTGRASAASTLIRYSPNSQMMHDNLNGINGPMSDADYMQRNHVVYSNGLIGPAQKDHSGDDSSMMYGGINESSMDGHSNRHIADYGFRHQQRNHMVEQSVISLGDENDYDDEEEAVAAAEEEEARQQNDYYSMNQHDQEAVSRPKRSKLASRARNAEQPTYGQQQQVAGYEQMAQSNDDQSSYMSGIYKRGHINERAFSYSIRQEHKSGGAVDSDDPSRNGLQHSEDAHLNQESQLYRDQSEYYQGNNDSQSNPVNELTSRLESQLNMKSFANSRIKSHM